MDVGPLTRSHRVHCEEKAEEKREEAGEEPARATRSVRAEFTKRSFKQSSLPHDRRSHKGYGSVTSSVRSSFRSLLRKKERSFLRIHEADTSRQAREDVKSRRNETTRKQTCSKT